MSVVPWWLALSACGPAPEPAPPPMPPVARVETVTDTFHGVEVSEDYRWLEDADDPAVSAWSTGQNQWARQVLDALPVREALRTELAAILGEERVSHYPIRFGGERIFASRDQPPKQQEFLVELTSLDAIEPSRVILDPEVVDPEGLTTIDWFVPSPDGTKVAVSLSRAGTESGDLHVVDADTGETLEPPIPRVHGGTAGGALAWTPDGTGFWYTRYPRDGERPPEDMAFFVQLWHHTLGEPASADRYELGKDLPRIAEIDLEVHEATGQVLVTVQDGDGGSFAHWIRGPVADGWRQISAFEDRVVMATFSEDGRSLYAVSFDDAPHGRVLQAPVAIANLLEAPVRVPEGDDTVVASFWSPPSIREHGGVLHVTYQTGGPSVIRSFTADGATAPSPAQPEVGAAGSLIPTPDGRLLFSAGSFVQPWTWYAFDGTSTTALPLNERGAVDLSRIEVRRELATSRDGTKVPLNILVPPDTALDGSNAAIVTGYGGYGVSLGPRYRSSWAPLLERGVVLVVANLRGGGEFGEDWHKQGNLTKKQNVFDDFHAVLQHLVERGYTRPERLGIQGGSNGGLLMGATFVQHPQAAAAVVSSVGIYDMLRVELSPNGAFNVTEFGTVKDPDHFRALRAYSPYHGVQDSTAYPPILFTTGANDPRVDPMQSRKMTARLQAATSSAAPILLRTSSDAGHGGGTPLRERIDLMADQFAFLLHHLGVK